RLRSLAARVPHPAEGGVAGGADAGPLRPGARADRLGLAPDGEPGLRTGRRPDGEGALRALSPVQLPRQVVDVAPLQARADPAREVEGLGLAPAKLGAPLIVEADEQRADPLRSATPARDVAA